MTTIPCVRSNGSSSQRQTVRLAHRIFAVERHPLHANAQWNLRLRAATIERLRSILSQVAAIAPPRGNRSAIDLVWLNLDELQVVNPAVRPHERVVYFVTRYRDGLVRPYVDRLLGGNRRGQSHYQQIANRYGGQRPNPPHAGVTLDDTELLDEEDIRAQAVRARRSGRSEVELTPLHRMLSEVHVEPSLRAITGWPPTGQTEESIAGAIRRAGQTLGGLAFHELMHNVIDVHEEASDSSFDLHSLGGIAAVDGHDANPQGGNLQRFRRYMFEPKPRQLLPSATGQLATPPAPRSDELQRIVGGDAQGQGQQQPDPAPDLRNQLSDLP